jgi:hypothetical protein
MDGLDPLASEFLPETTNMDIDRPGDTLSRAVPGLSEKILAGHQGIGISHKGMQQSELLQCQRHSRTVQ